MSKHLINLNERQKAAVIHTEGSLSIVAGAGSGKTRTLTHKLAYLIDEIKIAPYKLLAVTFTNKAANEMRERVVNLVGDKASSATISTYHSLCVKILRQEIGFFDLPRNFNIIDTIDQRQVLRPIYKKYNLKIRTLPFSQMIHYISKNKIKNNSPEYLIQTAKNDNEKIPALIFQDYEDSLKRSKSLDFDDLLLYVARLFKNSKEARDKWSKRFQYVLVDEFQDTSLIQYEIIKVLASSKNITIVGDPDQTIYTWRNADSTLIKKFNHDFSGNDVVKLEQNYRSTKTILTAANKLIKHNPNREEKNLFTEQNLGEGISFFHGRSEDAEGRWIANKIKDLQKNGVQLRDIAILYRSNYLSQALERQMIKNNVNYVIYGGIRFYERQEIKDCIAYLKLINNGDDVSMDRVINIPSRKIGIVALEKLNAFASKKKIGLTETLFKFNHDLPISKNQKNELNIFLNNIAKHRQALKTNSIFNTLDSFIKNINYISTINTIEDQSKIENIKELIKSIQSWEQNNPDSSLDDYLAEISLYTDREKGNSVRDQYISLMTVHSAKGLEFDHVFISSFSEGIFPSSRTINESKEGLYEERRLAYVAITRAKKQIYISTSKGYNIDFKTQKKPSRFIKELGIDIRNHSSEFIAPTDFKDNYEKDRNLLEGDIVEHIKFGLGTVVSLHGETIEIAFKAPHGLKSMMKNHKSIKVVH